MSIRPEFGPDYGGEKWEPEPEPDSLAEDENLGEREIQEHDREDREVEYFDPESNELHAAGQVCARCGTVITASQDVRLRPDGRWVHDECPIQPAGTP